MQRWEYQTLVIELEQSLWSGSTNFPHDAIQKLNELGQSGWELISAETNVIHQAQSSHLLCILKRPVAMN